jgi:uncharacterized cupin superfamily protein
MAAKRSRPADAGKLLIHEFRNCVHQINMELDLAERGVEEKFKYADLDEQLGQRVGLCEARNEKFL